MALPCQRDLFELPAEITYLNCAYLGPLSKGVLAAGQKGLARKLEPWTIHPADFFTDVEKARQLFASLVSGDAEGVALVPSVSYGITAAAENLEPAKGQEIIVLAEQFPSHVYPWREIAKRTGASMHTVARPADGDWTSAVLEVMGPATAIVALPHCHTTDGTIVDLELVGKHAREVGAALVVDGCQSIGALPFDVRQIQPDFLVTGAYKWLLGPYSQCLMWVAPRWRQGRPLEHTWIGRANAQDFTALTSYTEEYAPGARRFDVGEVSNFGLLPATIEALQQSLEWGVESIHETLVGFTDLIAANAERLGLGVPPKLHRAGHMIGMRLAGYDPRPLVTALAEARVYVSVRGDSVRVAPHVYNDSADIERFNAVLGRALGESAGRGAHAGTIYAAS
jgi:selenocysteine lyase/cysteine desulfurase